MEETPDYKDQKSIFDYDTASNSKFRMLEKYNMMKIKSNKNLKSEKSFQESSQDKDWVKPKNLK